MESSSSIDEVTISTGSSKARYSPIQIQVPSIEKMEKSGQLIGVKKYKNHNCNQPKRTYNTSFLLEFMETDIRLAVLIDGDNIPSAYIKEMMEEIAKYGNPTIKRIYGDWTRPGLTKWKDLLLENAITPIQQYGYTTGKNSTDSAMIIDAMDILYSEKVDGFCIVSSDSDFTRLATRLREAGMRVYGIGEKKTPKPFIVACDKFIYIEILHPAKTELIKKESKKKNKEKIQPELVVENPDEVIDMITPEVIRLISTTIYDLSGDDGWSFLGDVGALLQKKQPNFDPRNYGFNKLTPLLASTGVFDISERE